MEDFSIRLLSKKDAVQFYNLLSSNRDRLEDFFAGTIKHTKTLEETISYCAHLEKRILKKEYLPYLIFDKDNKAIGFIDLKNIDWDIPKAELGAFIDINYEGKGIVTKSFNYLLDNIVKHHEFTKLFCRISIENKRSIELALRCGFMLEGHLKNDYRTTKGELIDLNYYGRCF